MAAAARYPPLDLSLSISLRLAAPVKDAEQLLDDILSSIGDRSLHCLQPRTPTWYIATVQKEEFATKLLHGFQHDGKEVVCARMGRPVRTVIIRDVPWQMSEGQVKLHMSQYGKVVVVERVGRYRKDPLVVVGHWRVRIEMEAPVPNMMTWDEYPVLASWPGMTRVCFRCGRSGHEVIRCPTMRCNNCNKFGHRGAVCNDLCRKCPVPDHARKECTVRTFSEVVAGEVVVRPEPTEGEVVGPPGKKTKGNEVEAMEVQAGTLKRKIDEIIAEEKAKDQPGGEGGEESSTGGEGVGGDDEWEDVGEIGASDSEESSEDETGGEGEVKSAEGQKDQGEQKKDEEKMEIGEASGVKPKVRKRVKVPKEVKDLAMDSYGKKFPTEKQLQEKHEKCRIQWEEVDSKVKVRPRLTVEYARGKLDGAAVFWSRRQRRYLTGEEAAVRILKKVMEVPEERWYDPEVVRASQEEVVGALDIVFPVFGEGIERTTKDVCG